MTTKPRYRRPRDPDCQHPRLARTVAAGHGFVMHRDAAVFTCPDCAYCNYGDVGSRFDEENLRRLVPEEIDPAGDEAILRSRHWAEHPEISVSLPRVTRNARERLIYGEKTHVR